MPNQVHCCFFYTNSTIPSAPIYRAFDPRLNTLYHRMVSFEEGYGATARTPLVWERRYHERGELLLYALFFILCASNIAFDIFTIAHVRKNLETVGTLGQNVLELQKHKVVSEADMATLEVRIHELQNQIVRLTHGGR